MEPPRLHKVGIIATRPMPDGPQLLVFHHDGGGIQIPAGTVEPGEDLRVAAIRELEEETGVRTDDVEHLYSFDETFDPDEAVIVEDVPLQAGPSDDADIIMPSMFRTTVRLREERDDWTRVSVEEWNIETTPPYMTSSQDGWVPTHLLDRSQARHIYHARIAQETPESWEVFAEELYTFRCYWVPLTNSGLGAWQQAWVDRAMPQLRIGDSLDDASGARPIPWLGGPVLDDHSEDYLPTSIEKELVREGDVEPPDEDHA